MAAAMMGISKRRPQSSQEMSTSVGLTVSAPGTSAMSSKPYAARALRPRPTHIPIDQLLLSIARPCLDVGMPVARVYQISCSISIGRRGVNRRRARAHDGPSEDVARQDSGHSGGGFDEERAVGVESPSSSGDAIDRH